jgi:UDP-N-acetylmuramoyl-L-alanyl-D-glutamate--2,6-diaminopimelate ligase
MRLWQQVKNIYHFCEAYFWRAYFGWPDRGLHIYGVTGTNGKTTTCYVLASIWRAQVGQEKVGMLTTVAFWFGGREKINKTKMTTLPSKLVYQYLREMKNNGVTHVVLEMTSHALDQNRLRGIRLEGAIILNIEREHLDYHRTMEGYALAKQRIIEYLQPGAPLVGKGDDAMVRRMLEVARQAGVKVQEFISQDTRQVETSLPGDFNKENVLAASELARLTGVIPEAIRQGVASLRQVPGRMEILATQRGGQVLIDYAVTPKALENLYRYARAHATGRIFGVLGAAGLRDRGKRPEMARVVGDIADELILTREDPWTEKEEQIFQDLEKGLTNTKAKWQRIVDRREALEYALRQAQASDIVVVTGKGAEQGMAIGNTIIPWNDREVIENLLKEINSK